MAPGSASPGAPSPIRPWTKSITAAWRFGVFERPYSQRAYAIRRCFSIETAPPSLLRSPWLATSSNS